MHKLTFWLLSAFVFSIPWEQFVVAFSFSSLSRLCGAATIATGLLTVASSGRLRRPGTILCLASAFTLISMLSLLWTISPGDTVGRVLTYVQLLAVVWLVRDFASTRDKHQTLMLAYCLGGYVTILDLLRRFVTGTAFVGSRYSAGNANPNDLGLTLAIGVPMAWYLFVSRQGLVRVIALAYIPLTAVAILLTASRGSFLAFIIALGVVPLTLPGRSVRSLIMTITVLLVGAGSAALIVPQNNWDRILGTAQEVTSGTLSGRLGIWTAGLQVFSESPVLGIGGGAFDSAVEPLIGRRRPAHNVYVAVLVEQGVVGFFVFATLLAACGHCVYRLPSLERKVYGVTGLTWLVGVMSGAWQYHKVTWLLFALTAAQGTAKAAARQPSRSPQGWMDTSTLSRTPLHRPGDSLRVAQRTGSR